MRMADIVPIAVMLIAWGFSKIEKTIRMPVV